MQIVGDVFETLSDTFGKFHAANSPSGMFTVESFDLTVSQLRMFGVPGDILDQTIAQYLCGYSPDELEAMGMCLCETWGENCPTHIV